MRCVRLSSKVLPLLVGVLLLGLVAPNLQIAAAGSTLNLQGAWQVPSTGRTLVVIIIKSRDITDATVSGIVTSIMSTSSLLVGSETQYVGWTGAFQNTNVNGVSIPLFFAVTVTNTKKATGDITVTFEKGRPQCPVLGNTDLTKSGNFIVAAKITIFSCAQSRLNADGLQTVARILFGFALGLGTSTDPNDLMNPVLTAIKYISQCDIKGINTVYSNPAASSISCP